MRLKRRKSVSVLAAVATGTGYALAATAAGGAAAGPELKVSASDDSYTSSGRRTAGFGAEDKLVVGRLGGDVKISFLKFAVPAGAPVTGARLKLTTIGDVTGKVTVSRVLDNAWTEKKLTAASAPALGLPVAAGKSSGAAHEKKLAETVARLNEGIEKMEKAQAEPVARLAKVIETLDRVERRAAQLAAAEATGSTVPQTRGSHPQQLGAPPQQLQLPQHARPMGPAIVEGWRVRRVTDGIALLEGPDRIIEVEAGEVIRGVGRVDDIKRMDGRWVVVTPRGIIR